MRHNCDWRRCGAVGLIEECGGKSAAEEPVKAAAACRDYRDGPIDANGIVPFRCVDDDQECSRRRGRSRNDARFGVNAESGCETGGGVTDSATAFAAADEHLIVVGQTNFAIIEDDGVEFEIRVPRK